MINNYLYSKKATQFLKGKIVGLKRVYVESTSKVLNKWEDVDISTINTMEFCTSNLLLIRDNSQPILLVGGEWAYIKILAHNQIIYLDSNKATTEW